MNVRHTILCALIGIPGFGFSFSGIAAGTDEALARDFIRCSIVAHEAARHSARGRLSGAQITPHVFTAAAIKVSDERFVSAELPKVQSAWVAEVRRQSLDSIGAFVQDQVARCSDLYPTAAAKIK